MLIKVRRTYKYRLNSNSKRNRHLYDQINIAGIIWNHCVALARRYYRLSGKYIGQGCLKAHIAKLRMKRAKFAHWKLLNSQTVQEIIERFDQSYQRFFAKQGGLPHFRKVKKFRSIVFKQAGWKLLPDNPEKPKQGKIQIQGKVYKFIKHREMHGEIKTVSIKRDSCGRLWVCFSVVEEMAIPEISSGQIGGFDFGLKTFLTDHGGTGYISQEYLKQELERIQGLSRSVSIKRDGSNNQRKARWLLNRTHIRIADKRADSHFKLAHQLCDQYAVLVFEDLNIDAMKRLWGRKVSDLGFSQFMKIVQWVAYKRGVKVRFVDRFEPTTQLCSHCQQKQKLTLAERVFQLSELWFTT